MPRRGGFMIPRRGRVRRSVDITQVMLPDGLRNALIRASEAAGSTSATRQTARTTRNIGSDGRP